MWKELRTATLSSLMVLGVLFALGATWNSAFETTPSNTENISLGAQRIRETRNESRLRLDAEHDFGTFTGGNSDTGRQRLGSARPFYQSTGPTVLGATDALGSASLDTGRLWIDTDDVGLRHYNGSSWVATAAMIAPTVATATDAGGAACVAGGGATDWGGGVVSVAVPAAGTYHVYVFGHQTVERGSAFGGPLTYTMNIMQDPGTGSYSSVSSSSTIVPRSASDGARMSLAGSAVTTGATNGVTYNYKIQCTNASGGGLDFVTSGGNSKLTVVLVRGD